MANPRKSLGKGELEILKLVQEHQPVTVRDVTALAADLGGQARTTTLTVMERLRRKGFLQRRKVDGVNHYTAVHTPEEVLDGTVDNFVHSMLGGSVSPFVSYLSRSPDLSETEIEHLRKVVRKLSKRGADEGERGGRR